MVQTCGRLLVGLALLLCCTSVLTAEEPCRLPAAWSGQWYWKGSILNISTTVIGDRGRCVRMNRIRYLLERENNGRKCYSCVVLFPRHDNIIEFKESRVCTARPSLEFQCRSIAGDSPLNTMVRVRAEPVPCPFRGAFTFDYRRSDKVCDSPISRVSACSDPWRLVLHHQACPDVAGAERISEKLTCLATWRNHNEQFMFGRLDSVKTKTDADRYRCFKSRRFDNGDGNRGYHVVQSGDSTCQGLRSVHEGHKVMSLYDDKLQSGEKCRLPAWLTEHHEWYSMDSRLRFHIFHKNHSIKVSQQPRSDGVSSDSEPTKLLCMRPVEETETMVRLVLHHSHDCTSGYQCAVFFKRAGHVVETKFGDLDHSPDTACQYFDERRKNFTTLIAAGHPGHQCPYLGRHAVIGVRREGRVVRDACAGGFSTLVMGCSSSDTLELRSECPQRQQPTQYRCHGNWEENGTHFLVTSPVGEADPSVQERRICFISMATSRGLRFSTMQEACYRNVSLGQEGSLAFNVTISGDCRAEAVQARSTGRCTAAGALSVVLGLLLTHLVSSLR